VLKLAYLACKAPKRAIKAAKEGYGLELSAESGFLRAKLQAEYKTRP
jgi:hypothetical protein